MLGTLIAYKDRIREKQERGSRLSSGVGTDHLVIIIISIERVRQRFEVIHFLAEDDDDDDGAGG
jgi:hypothetical protein